MAMKRVLLSDALSYRAWDGVTSPSYHSAFVTPPRIYAQSCYTVESGVGGIGGRFWGTVWTTATPNAFSNSTLEVYSVMQQIEAPSWGHRRWSLAGGAGELISGTDYLDGAFGSMQYGAFAVDPNGAIWEYGGHPFVDDGGAVMLSTSDFSVIPGSLLDNEDFGRASFDTMDAFGIDVAANRCWVTWATADGARVYCYNLSTKAQLHSICTPSTTLGIVPTGDGHVYLYDDQGWVCLYTYGGILRGAFKNDTANQLAAGGVSYGWDPHHLRLLRLRGTPNASDGACTVQVEGFYPVIEHMHLSVPIPRSVPRKGRTTYYFSRVLGNGGEPCAGIVASQSGTTTTANLVADSDGDVLGAVTPASTADATVTFEVPDP